MDAIERHHISTTLAQLIGRGLRIEYAPMQDLCVCCREYKLDVARRRLNAAYANDELNWLDSCGDCFEEAVEHYQDLWDTY